MSNRSDEADDTSSVQRSDSDENEVERESEGARGKNVTKKRSMTTAFNINGSKLIIG